MTIYSIVDIARIVKGTLIYSNSENTDVSILLIDSRKVLQAEKSLFFALSTKKNDGHNYIKELYEKGVRNFIVEKNPETMSLFHLSANFIVVKNTKEALQNLAAHHRSLFSIPVVGITGSNGKTIIKEWIKQLIGQDKKMVCSPKSYNSQIGVPLSVWEITPEDELAVFEAGISQPKEMVLLEKIMLPSIGIFTNIGQAHDENFQSATQKIEEKLNLFKHSQTLIYCADHSTIDHYLKKNHALPGMTFFTWGKNTDVNLQIKKIETQEYLTILTVCYKSTLFNLSIPFTDSASIENAMHCVAFMLFLGYEPDIIAERIQTLSPVEMRLELKEGINGCTLINDSYSSDFTSLVIALNFLQQQNQHQKKTLILSDIPQSGREENDLYSEIAKLIHEKGITQFIGIGNALSRNKALFSKESVFFLSTEDFLSQHIFSNFNQETILLKGARTFTFEQISRILQKKSHQTVLEIDLSALTANLNFYRSKLKPKTKLMAMVKAFSYGSGSTEIASLLEFNRVDYLTVAYCDEGIELRQAGITLPIMVMNPEADSMAKILRYSLEPDIYNFRVLQLLIDEIRSYPGTKKEIPIHIELDTGMRRLGFSKTDMEILIPILLQNPELQVKSVFSHLVASEDLYSDPFTESQAALYNTLTAQLENVLQKPFIRHILNSSGIQRFPDYQFDMVRLGIGLYGISSDYETQKYLQNVGTLKTIISQIKRIDTGESVGYNRKWIASKPSMIAVLPIGYADGLNRKLSNGVGNVWINGKPAPIAGNICMDMCMVDVSEVECKEMDEVIIFGKENPVSNLAKALDTIPYEILTSISHRVKRVYYQE